MEGKLETQCWICPICFDDHRFNEDRVFCKTADLEKLRSQHDKYRDTLIKMTVLIEKVLDSPNQTTRENEE